MHRNQLPERSFTLQEVLLPTLPDALGLTMRDYPPEIVRYNRYRPYHSLSSVREAHTNGRVAFAHPVRREPADPARRFTRSLSA